MNSAVFEHWFLKPFPLQAIFIMATTFYLLAIAVNDARMSRDHPYLKSTWTRLVLFVLFTGSSWYLFAPDYSRYTWMLTNTGVCVALGFMVFKHRRHYGNIKIQVQGVSELLRISKDEYVEVSKGVWCRIYDPGSKLVLPLVEAKIIESISEYDLSKYYIVFVRSEKGGEFKEHIHPESSETLVSTTGAVSVGHGREPAIPGKPSITPAGEPHHFKSLTFFEGAVLLSK